MDKILHTSPLRILLSIATGIFFFSIVYSVVKTADWLLYRDDFHWNNFFGMAVFYFLIATSFLISKFFFLLTVIWIFYDYYTNRNWITAAIVGGVVAFFFNLIYTSYREIQSALLWDRHTDLILIFIELTFVTLTGAIGGALMSRVAYRVRKQPSPS